MFFSLSNQLINQSNGLLSQPGRQPQQAWRLDGNRGNPTQRSRSQQDKVPWGLGRGEGTYPGGDEGAGEACS